MKAASDTFMVVPGGSSREGWSKGRKLTQEVHGAVDGGGPWTAVLRHPGQEDTGDRGSGCLHFAGLPWSPPLGLSPTCSECQQGPVC